MLKQKKKYSEKRFFLNFLNNFWSLIFLFHYHDHHKKFSQKHSLDLHFTESPTSQMSYYMGKIYQTWSFFSTPFQDIYQQSFESQRVPYHLIIPQRSIFFNPTGNFFIHNSIHPFIFFFCNTIFQRRSYFSRSLQTSRFDIWKFS